DPQLRTIGDAVRCPVLALVVDDGEGDVPAHGDQLAAPEFGNVPVTDLDLAFGARLEERGVDHLCRPADMEGPHGELGSRLADGLRGNDADSLADIDRSAPCQVAAVAGGAAPLPQVADQRR